MNEISTEAKTISRYSKPNKYDHAPRGTICKVFNGTNTEYYMQVNSDDANPSWQQIGQDRIQSAHTDAWADVE